MAGLLSTVFMFAGLLSNLIFAPSNKNPPWLESLLIEYQLLSKQELNFIVDVRFKTINEMQSRKEPSFVSRSKIKEPVIVRNAYLTTRIKEDFKQVIEHMKRSIPLQKTFIKAYPEWRASRDFNVKVLEEISDAMDDHKRKCRFAKIAGTLTSLIGGGLAFFSGSDDADISKLIGGIMMGIGTLTSGGTEVTEAVLLNRNIEQAKEVVKKDSKNLESFLEWLKLADKLSDDLDSIRSADSNLLDTARKVVAVSKKNLNEKEKEKAVEDILKLLNVPPQLAEEIADALGILVSIVMLQDRYPLYFNLILQTRNYIPKLKLSMTLFKSALSSMSSVSSATKSTLTVAQKSMITAGMLLDVYSIIVIALENPESVEGSQIRQVANALKSEADVFKVLYHKMWFLGKSTETRAP